MANTRASYNKDLKWNVDDLYETEEAFFAQFKELEKRIEDYEKYRGHILDSAKNLYEFLVFDTENEKMLEQLYVYAHIQNDQDMTNTKFQEMESKTYKLYLKSAEKTSFVVPELLKSSLELILGYIDEEPGLLEYKRMLEELFKFKDHTLSEQEEQILSSVRGAFNTPDEVYSLLTDADMKFPKTLDEDGNMIELTEKNYPKLLRSKDRKVRSGAFKNLLETFGKFKNTYAALLSNNVQNDNRIAHLRKYESSLQASLYANDVPMEIYHNLLDTVKKNVDPLSKFWKLKRRSLGVDELHIYDTYAPLVESIDKKYTEEEAKEVILNALSPLGKTYIEDLTRAFEDRWIDYCPNEGKRNGAYCTAVYNVHPYVLTNFDGTLTSVSTLAHELGHAMHYHYAIANRTYQDYNYTIFVAEVASQVNQILLSKYLIENTRDIEEKKYLIDDLIQDFKSTIYRQTMFADFELSIHEKEAEGEVLTHEMMCELYYDLNRKYYGKNIVVDEAIKYEWERIPHFYTSFYVYQYATSYAASIKIAQDILNKREGAVENYLEFLKLGCTKNPIESLKVAGVDMSKPTPLIEAFAYFEDLVNELDKFYKEV